jgi:transcriptional regulator of acetoin/glycerol metabolism
MARSRLIVISDDHNLTLEAERWGRQYECQVESYTQTQWNEHQSGGRPSFEGSSPNNVLPFPGSSQPQREKRVLTMNEIESQAIESAIFEYKGNLTEAARALGIGRATLYRKVKQYNIDPSQARSRTPKAA